MYYCCLQLHVTATPRRSCQYRLPQAGGYSTLMTRPLAAGGTDLRLHSIANGHKIAFGKYREDGGRIMMPVSVEVHHALMDGLHVGRYLERLESYFSSPRSVLGL